ncbi:MAG: V-type ATPase 116kDa subunit family protein [Bacteroidota bacterium]
MKAVFKKIELLIFHRERDHITSMLQELGVLHLELDMQLSNESIEAIELKKKRLERALETLDSHIKRNGRNTKQTSSEAKSIEDVTDEILNLRHQQETDNQAREVIRKNKLKLLPWGNFDLNKLAKLRAKGVNLHFFIAKKKEFRNHDFGDLAYTEINHIQDQVYFVVASHGATPTLPFESVELPKISLQETLDRESELDASSIQLDDQIGQYIPYRLQLSQQLRFIENQWMYLIANSSYEEMAEGAILSLSGWFPAPMEERLLFYLKKENVTYAISDAEPSDQVPVLLKNPKYPKFFEPITRIFQLPNYYELDLTPFIAVFYPILFAYCLGDAGYGLILLIAAVVGAFTFLKTSRGMAILGIILGVMTTVMGVIKSGSIFGLPLAGEDANPLFSFLAEYILIPDDREFWLNAFNVALMIGVVQILSGIMISIYNKVRYHSMVAALPQVGKLFMVTSLIWIFLADMQGVAVLAPLPIVRQLILVTGVLLVLFFHDMKKSIVGRTASGILPLFFIVTGILGDVLSYVRLFALGVASSVLGLVVNQIGMGMINGAWWGFILAIVFLLIGHGLNFALATLGAFVHPLRLTFVEFYNNAQFEGGGVEYKPFRKHS